MVDTEDPLPRCRLSVMVHPEEIIFAALFSLPKKGVGSKITNRIGVYSGERNLNGRMYVDLVLF